MPTKVPMICSAIYGYDLLDNWHFVRFGVRLFKFELNKKPPVGTNWGIFEYFLNHMVSSRIYPPLAITTQSGFYINHKTLPIYQGMSSSFIFYLLVVMSSK